MHRPDCPRGGDSSLLVSEQEPAGVIAALRDALDDRLYGMIARHRRKKRPARPRLRERARRYVFPLVAAVEILYHSPRAVRCRMC